MWIFRLDQALVLTFLSIVLHQNIFHRLFYPRSIYLFAVFSSLCKSPMIKRTKIKTMTAIMRSNEANDDEDDDDDERRRGCALLCVRIQIYAALLGKLKRGEGPFE